MVREEDVGVAQEVQKILQGRDFGQGRYLYRVAAPPCLRGKWLDAKNAVECFACREVGEETRRLGECRARRLGTRPVTR